ncbi:hypothetical protein EDB92DRAFT_1824094, partial [Lactarius akahatsu]
MSYIRMTWLPSPPAKVITGNGIEGILKPISVLAILQNVLRRSPCDALAPSIDYFFGLRLADQVWNAACSCHGADETSASTIVTCKRPLPWYKSDPVVEPPPKRVRFDPDILLDKDIVMDDLTPVNLSTGVPQLEQKTPDNQGELEAEVLAGSFATFTGPALCLVGSRRRRLDGSLYMGWW